MTTTNFVDQVTEIEADWANDVDAVTYETVPRLSDSSNVAYGDAGIAVKRTATGATAKTLHEANELEPYYVKRDFGATLDGVADDASAVQSAITAANGTGRTVVFDGPQCKITTSISLNNYAHFNIDFGQCNVSFTGGAGTYLLDMTQAGRIRTQGGVFTGNANNHFVKTIGSSAAQATSYPTVPAEDQWSRDLWFEGHTITAFASVFDLQNFTRELWIQDCYITGNTKAIKITGKVVNIYGSNSVLYSSSASTNAVYIRADVGDTWRYAEGIFLENCICDTQGTTLDLRDVYVFRLSGGQAKTASGGYAIDVTKGTATITRDIYVTDVLMQGKLRIGTGLGSQFFFDFHSSGLSFDGVTGTAINIEQYCKMVTIRGASFTSGSSTPRMFAVGADCVNIRLLGLNPDATTYTNLPTINSGSLSGVEAEFTGTWTPAVQFGGASVGVAYSTQVGKYFYNRGHVSGYFEITLSNKGSSTGVATIAGLPFACQGITGTATLGRYASMSTAFYPLLSIASGSTTIEVRTAGGGSDATFSETDFSNTSVLRGSITYSVN